MARESREGGENKKLRIKREPIDEKVIFWPDDKGEGDGEFDVHCDPLGSPGTPLVGFNRQSMESNFDTSQVTRFKNWRRATHDSCNFVIEII